MLAGVASHLLSMAHSIDKNTSFDNLKVKDCINRAKIIFMDNFAKNMNLQKVAEEVNLSYSRFRYLFKEYTGFAPAQYLQELRIVHSKELLANTTLSINEIAFECGFETCQYFCIVFKNKIGSTPTEYRKFTQGENA
jgi:AraC-like DNA-binding protein